MTVTVSGPEGEDSTTTLSCSNTCLADFNDDGVVNFLILALLRANFGAPDCSLLPPEQVCVGDANGDGLVNFTGLGTIAVRIRSQRLSGLQLIALPMHDSKDKQQERQVGDDIAAVFRCRFDDALLPEYTCGRRTPFS
jgi:hypothetical protein